MQRAWLTVGASVLVLNLLVLLSMNAGVAPLLLACALLVPLGLALVRRPQLGLLLLSALVPFDGLLLLVPNSGALQGWKEVIVVITLLATFLAPSSARGPAGRTFPGWVPGAAALVAVGLVSALVAHDARGVFGMKIAFFYLLVAVVAWRCPLDAAERDRLVTIMLATGVATALYGVLQQLIGPAGLAAMGYEYNSAIRFSGPYLRSFSSFIQPFPFALFLMVVILLGVAHALAEPSRLRSRVTFLVLPVLAVGIALTFVRAAWLGLAVGLLVLGVKRHRSLLLGVPVALLVLLFLPASVSTTALSGSSSTERLDTWSESLATVQEEPWGTGIGTGGSAAQRVVEAGVEAEVRDKLLLLPDNHYFKVLYELGVIGLWLFVLVLVAAYRCSQDVALGSGGRDASLGWAVTAIVAGAAAASFMANVFEIFPVDVLFWLLLATVTSGGTRRPGGAPEAQATPGRLAVAP